MSLGASKHFCVHNFTSSHLDKRRSTKEDLSLVFDKDAVVRQSGMVGPSGR